METRPNPINQEMHECLGLYERYYNLLKAELSKWIHLEKNISNIVKLPDQEVPMEEKVELGHKVVGKSIHQLDQWLRSLPFSVS